MGASKRVQLPANLTIANVQGLHEKLENLMHDENSDQIVLTSSKVERADTAGVQLLLAFVLAAKERSIKVEWQKPTEPLVTAAQILGIESELGLAS